MVTWGRRWKLLVVVAGPVALAIGLVRAFWMFDPVNHPAAQAAQFRALSVNIG